MLNNRYKYIILWWWLSGLSGAYILSQKFKWEVLIIEKDNVLWWLSKSIISASWDKLDFWSHRLQDSYIPNIIDFIKNKLNINLIRTERLSKLHINKSFISYPINSFELFKKISLIRSVWSLLQSFFYKIKYRNKNTFDKKTKSRVWNYIYDNFYANYAKKVWGIELSELSDSILKKRFRLNPIHLLKQLIFKKKRFFTYPIGGFWKIIENYYKELKTNNIDFILWEENYNINLKDNCIEIDREKIYYDNLISTIPIDSLIRYIDKTAESWLSYRGLYVLYLYIDKLPVVAWETFYFPSKDFIFWRVSIPKRFDKTLQKDDNYTIYSLEIPASENEYNKDYMIEKSVEWLLKSWLISDDYIIDKEKSFFSFEKNVYPMYRVGWEKEIRNTINNLSNKYKNLYISWRQWLFLHCNIDHTMSLWFELWDYLLNNNDNTKWVDSLEKYYNCVVRD